MIPAVAALAAVAVPVEPVEVEPAPAPEPEKVVQYPTRRSFRPTFPKSPPQVDDQGRPIVNRKMRRAHDAKVRSIAFVRHLNADNRDRAKKAAA